jgi:hypothetical protein
VAKYRKKGGVVDAVQWFKNGDHPDDDCSSQGEGHVVRYYRHPILVGNAMCAMCRYTMHVHGWIEMHREGGRVVCPGDFIVTDAKGERYPCKPDVFAATFEPVEP